MKKFNIKLLQETMDFLEEIEQPAAKKILYNLKLAETTMDSELFKKIDDDIWEFRTIYNNKKYRLLAFWDKREKGNTLVISTHGFIKKTEKTPPREIKKAIKIMTGYFNSD